MRWRYQFFWALLCVSGTAVSCNLNSPEPVTLALPSLAADDSVRSVLLSNNIQLNLPDAAGVLQIHSSDGLALLDQLANWPTGSGDIATIHAQPVLLDDDYDGKADAVYVVDIDGRVWFVPLTAAGFSTPVAIADFSDSGLSFLQPLRMVQTFAADISVTRSRQNMLLLVGSDVTTGDTLFTIRHQPQRLAPLQLNDLMARTNIGDDELRHGIDEHLWQQIQHAAGWYVQLNGRITAVPQVYAGVVYLTAADIAAVQPDCSVLDSAEMTLHALHLHHAGAVYAQRNWEIEALAQAKLTLQQDSAGQLALMLTNTEQQLSISAELLAISEECADCTVPLRAEQFPKLIRLATYQTEFGAH
ncbi:hypothetical protein [Rheinheimera maricola]|uniref:VCBS repeat-containing protein n=1 Tax=Rheinheimera maricola TaxID=2793282 RepID=A0ABS7XBV7_9GAMM|nr:hypothetical protein [Rheinheimera maricola]MBZ9612540.1 hypothetical protein [Rheinheimera maricola]